MLSVINIKYKSLNYLLTFYLLEFIAVIVKYIFVWMSVYIIYLPKKKESGEYIDIILNKWVADADN